MDHRRAFTSMLLAACVVLTACSSDSRPAAGSASSAESGTLQAVRASCAPARADLAAGAQTLAFDGEQRSYLLHLPPGYDGRTAAPVVFDFHGFASDGPTENANTAMGEKGSARGYVVVTPTADPPEWNEFSDPTHADDFGFVAALLRDLTQRLCVDSSRVYAAGHSNGSAFVGFLACKPPFAFAAIAMVSATVPPLCPGATGPSVLAVAGTDDPQVPYGGGTVSGSTIQIPAVLATMSAYADHYHCDPVSNQDAPLPGVQHTQYDGCTRGVALALDTIVGGTHEWPGGAAARANMADSAAGRQFDATAAVLDFFDAAR